MHVEGVRRVSRGTDSDGNEVRGVSVNVTVVVVGLGEGKWG